MKESEYKALKEEAEGAKVAADRAQGALDAALLTLEKEFGIKTVKEAKAQLKRAEALAEEAEEEFETALEEYREKWHKDES